MMLCRVNRSRIGGAYVNRTLDSHNQVNRTDTRGG
jgi:hypothetical protein